MLSRVADSLYWTGRYVERAELMGRLVHVYFHDLLDAEHAGRAEQWRRLVALAGAEDLFSEHHEEYTSQAVGEFMLWGPENPNAVDACIARARENARGLRDQISTEMWEELNRLHLYLGSSRLQGLIQAQHRLFVRVRQGAQGFGGIMEATLPRGEAYEFLLLGRQLERAEVTARILAAEGPVVSAARPGSLQEISQLTRLLKSCGALEAFRKTGESLRAPQVLEYLLVDRACPRSVLFCLEGCRRALDAMGTNLDRPQRAIGRVTSDLSFLDPAELGPSRLTQVLERLQAGIATADREIAATFFTTRVLVPGAFAQAQAQQ